jgi:hypothetical protein
MNTHTRTRLQWAAVLSAAALLAACGDSDSGDSAAAPPAPTPPAATGDVPASAQISPTAWTNFVKAQGKTETGKPLDLTGVVAPFSESEAPQAL